MVYAAFLTGFLAQPVFAGPESNAEQQLKTAVGLVAAFMKDQTLDGETRRSKVMDVINSAFDFPLIAKLTLGKRDWPKFNREQKKEFVQLFTRQLENTYYSETDFFAENTIQFEQPVRKKRKIEILTKISQKEVELLYKLYNSRGKWRIYDVEIQGVSLISSFRAQYRQFLKTGTIEEFLEKIREKVNSK
ncbi:MAG: phospholipid-binding protein MlaC [Nitrospinota bacterium]